MKKIFLCVLLVVASIIATACADNGNLIEDYENTIASLESQIEELKNEQQQKDEEREKKIAELMAQVELLRNNDSGGSDVQQENTSDEKEQTTGFKYTVQGNEAIITGYSGQDTDIVIPSSIDGYRVTAIGDNAFEDTMLTSVIISNGVKQVGWFAFNGCMKLKSIVAPSSITEIGYSAFGNPGSSLTLYCHEGSYALSYAKSFGITYAVV